MLGLGDRGKGGGRGRGDRGGLNTCRSLGLRPFERKKRKKKKKKKRKEKKSVFLNERKDFCVGW